MLYSIKTSPQMTTWRAMLDVWREADDIEIFHGAWNFDHFYPILGQPLDGPCLEAWTTLAALAQATKRLRVGVMVTGNIYRHPAVLANMAATVDIISNGRLDLGIGAGWNEDETAAYGIYLPPLAERFDRFDEACEVITGLLTEHSFSFAGEHYLISDAHCEPKPVQTPHPPICIGGDGEKRTLRAVARYAQIWNTPFTDKAALAHKLSILEGHCADIGRDMSEVTISAQVIHDPALGLGALGEQIGELADAGLDLAVIYIPTPHDPAILEPLGRALSDLQL